LPISGRSSIMHTPSRPPTSTPFPYTTLFRSRVDLGVDRARVEEALDEPRGRAIGKALELGDVERRPGLELLQHERVRQRRGPVEDRKSTRLNSSHDQISYAVFCLKKKKNSMQ